MTWVLRRNEDGKFVTPPGSEKSYTPAIQRAATWPTKEAAEANACGNERAVEKRLWQSERSSALKHARHVANEAEDMTRYTSDDHD